MSADNFKDNQGHKEDKEERPLSDATSRARNQTVMLTPEVTGQVRALLNKKSGGVVADPLSELLPPMSSTWDASNRDKRNVAESIPNSSHSHGSHAPVSHATNAYSAILEQGAPSPRGQNVTTIFNTEALHDVQHFEDDPTGGYQTTGGASGGVSSSGRPQPSYSVNLEPHRKSEPAKSSSKPFMQVPVQATRKSKIVGFLVSFDNAENGEVHEICAGRWLVTSRPTEHGDFILLDDESIEPLHAIMRATDAGNVQVLDQLSKFGTGVTRAGSSKEEDVAGAMCTIGHGDTIRFGKRNYVFCVIPKISSLQQKKVESE